MSMYTLRTGVTNHPEGTVNQLETDLFPRSYLARSGDFAVSQQSTPTMTINIGTGDAYLRGATTSVYRVRSTEVETLLINSNTSGNARYTSIVLYVDLTLTPNSTGQASDLVFLKAIDGEPSANPSLPSDADIQADDDVGLNPFLILANILVEDGASAINDTSINNLDLVAPATKAGLSKNYLSIETVIDTNLGSRFQTAISANTTLTTKANDGDVWMLKLSFNGSDLNATFANVTDDSGDAYIANGSTGDLLTIVFEKYDQTIVAREL